MSRLRIALGKTSFLFTAFVFCLVMSGWAQAGPRALIDFIRDGHEDIGVLDIETGFLLPLTNTPDIGELGLSWSPDGQRILFLSAAQDLPYQLEIMNADGTGRKALDFIQDSFWGADWSPSGEQLILGLKKEDHFSIFTVRPDGGRLQQITKHPADDLDPIWSPDGSRIAFRSNRKDGWQLYVIDADGKNLIQLTRDLGEIQSPPSWSPDGQQIVCDLNRRLFIVDANGQGKSQEVDVKETDFEAAPVHWLPDGRILFHFRDQVYTVDVREVQGKFEGENLTLVFAGNSGKRPQIKGWFDPAFARPVQPQQKLPTLLGQVKAATLWQNYPNPFNPDTWIPFELSVDGSVTIQIHDVQGYLIRTLGLGSRKAGAYLLPSQSAYWDGHNQAGQAVGSGVYFYTLQMESFATTRRMLLLK